MVIKGITHNYEMANSLINSICVLKCGNSMNKDCLKVQCRVRKITQNLEYHYSMRWFNLVSMDLKKVLLIFLESLKV